MQICIHTRDDCSISTDDCCLKFQSLRHLYIIGFKWCKLVGHFHHSLSFKNYDLVTSRRKVTGSYFSCRYYIGVFLLLYELPSLRLRSPVSPTEESLSRARFRPGIFSFSQYGNPPEYQREANRYYTLPKGDLELCKIGEFNSLTYYGYMHTHKDIHVQVNTDTHTWSHTHTYTQIHTVTRRQVSYTHRDIHANTHTDIRTYRQTHTITHRHADTYVVSSISFQRFFKQAFKIVVDFWKFTMLLLYILWDNWRIFVISCSNEQLRQQLE